MHHQLDFCYLAIVLYITQYHWNKNITCPFIIFKRVSFSVVVSVTWHHHCTQCQCCQHSFFLLFQKSSGKSELLEYPDSDNTSHTYENNSSSSQSSFPPTPPPRRPSPPDSPPYPPPPLSIAKVSTRVLICVILRLFFKYTLITISLAL